MSKLQLLKFSNLQITKTVFPAKALLENVSFAVVLASGTCGDEQFNSDEADFDAKLETLEAGVRALFVPFIDHRGDIPTATLVTLLQRHRAAAAAIEQAFFESGDKELRALAVGPEPEVTP